MPQKIVPSFVSIDFLMPICDSLLTTWRNAQPRAKCPGNSLDQLELHNVTAEAANYSGKAGVPRGTLCLNAANGASFYAILTGSRFHNELLKSIGGKPGRQCRPGAAASSKSRFPGPGVKTARYIYHPADEMGGPDDQIAGTTKRTPQYGRRPRNSISFLRPAEGIAGEI